ncbi:AAA family ATPase [Actinomyces culturomici]|uniref:AAA family ATPase n=1 Tax=Actinomyces culturomici TaxID=1926276 RepID=UPI00135BFAE1|nr:SMC family ATPase [Actinomyces culturomici]
MRLHRLAFTAIGPFAGTEIIDFTAFDDSGLFLLEGPTGAGKSTIIDAVVFALYGDVARQKDASKDRLRSDLAAPKVHSEVDLVFETGAGLHRVHRSPAYTPKGRKSPRNDPATLVRVVEDPSAEDGYRTVGTVERGARQVDPEIRRLVGLSKEQFLQTVVLPQGKFAEFLTATSQEREGVLRDIFDTRIFQDFQARLVAAGSRTRALVDETERECARAFATVLALAPDAIDEAGAEDSLTGGDSATEESAPPDPLAEDSAPARAAADAVLASAEDRLRAARGRLAGLRTAADAASAALAEGRRLAERLEERAERLAERESLDARREAVDIDRELLAAARTAALVVPALDAALAADDRLARAVENLRAARADADEALDGAEPVPALGPDEEWGARIQRLARSRTETIAEHRARIRDLVDLERGLEERRADLAAREARIGRLEQELDEVAERVAAYPPALEAAEASRSAMARDLAELEGAATRVESLEKRAAAAAEARDLIEELKARADAVSTAARAARDARDAAIVGHEAWLASTGAALAAELEDGVPCPVCGSPDHPDPAIDPDAPAPGRDEVAALDEAKRVADDALATAQHEHARTTEALKGANARADGDVASIALLLDAARADATRARELTSSLARLDADLAGARKELEDARARESSLGQVLAEGRASARALREGIEADAAACAAAAPAGGSLAALDDSCTDSLAALDMLSQALSSWERASAAARTAGGAAATALADAGFADGEEGAAAARARLLPDARVAELADGIRRFDARSAAVDDLLASERLSGLDGVAVPDLDGLAAAAAAARAADDAAQVRLGELARAAEQTSGAHTDFLESRRLLDAARRDAGPVRRLAGIADATSKENLVATPLSAWVLVSRLDDVLAAANPRLLAISSGRYELVSAPDDGTSSRKSGLGLRVVDHDAEETRSPRTLSGGETFYASLALALGLADVVASEAGGVELRTMFIDEGFGSLDAATLDLVMAELHALRDSGRTVGVISHVDEMARQIPDQIRVRPNGREGSTLSLRV